MNFPQVEQKMQSEREVLGSSICVVFMTAVYPEPCYVN